MRCARCGQLRSNLVSYPWEGWKTHWQNGMFWICPDCLNELLGWWLDLTKTMQSPDPSKLNQNKR